MQPPSPPIALRPLELKQLFDFTIRLYRSAFAPMFLSMAVVQLPQAALMMPFLLAIFRVADELAKVQQTGANETTWLYDQLDPLIIAAIWLLCGAIYQLLIMPLGILTCSRLAVQALHGERVDLLSCVRYARARYWPTQLAIAIFLLPLLGLALVSLLPVLFATGLGDDAAVLGATVLALSLIFLGSIGTLLLYCRVYPVMAGVLQAAEEPVAEGVIAQGNWFFKRAWGLTEGQFWRTLGMLLLMLIAMSSIQRGINQSIQLMITAVQAAQQNPQHMAQSFTDILMQPYDPTFIGILMVLMVIVSLLFPALWICFQVLLYYDLRCRKEGYDLKLLLEAESAPAI
jgi:hypothetical protein